MCSIKIECEQCNLYIEEDNNNEDKAHIECEQCRFGTEIDENEQWIVSCAEHAWWDKSLCIY